MMSTLFLDVLGNGKLVDGYQIDDSIAQKYHLKPGTICPFTHLRVEILSPQQVRAAEEAQRQKKIKQQKKALGKEKQKRESNIDRKKQNPSAVNSKSSGYVADIKKTTKRIEHPTESHDFAHRRARTGRGPVRRNRILEREEVRMATVKKVPVKSAKAAAKAPAKTKTPVKSPAKPAAKPVKAKAKAVAKSPVKAKVKAVAKSPAKAKAKAKAKAPAKAKAVAKKPTAKKPAKAKK
jgi:hypothetical protein